MKNVAYKLPVAVAGAAVVLVGGFALSQTPPQEPQDNSLLASLGFTPLVTEQNNDNEEQDIVSGDALTQKVAVAEVAQKDVESSDVQQKASLSEAVSVYEVPEEPTDLEKIKAELEVLKKDKEERDAAQRAQEEAKRAAQEAAEKEERDAIVTQLENIEGLYYNPDLDTEALRDLLDSYLLKQEEERKIKEENEKVKLQQEQERIMEEQNKHLEGLYSACSSPGRILRPSLHIPLHCVSA